MALKNEKDKFKKDDLKAGDVSENKIEAGQNADKIVGNLEAETSSTETAETKLQDEKEEVLEISKEEKKEKVMYIGPNIKGLLQNTVFDYMPSMESYEEYKNIEKLFIKLPAVKESILRLKEKSNVLHIIFDDIQKTEEEKRKGREF